MQSRFLNGFLVFISPDAVFKRTVKAESAFEPLISLLIFAGLATGLGIKLMQQFAFYEVNLTLSRAILSVFAIFFLFILATAVISGLSDFIFSAGIRSRNKTIKADFLSSFCAHAYIIPEWIFLLAIYLFLPGLEQSQIFQVSAVLIMIRLLDVEARLIKAVYKLRLIQSYVLIFAQILLVALGISMAYFSKYLISYLN